MPVNLSLINSRANLYFGSRSVQSVKNQDSCHSLNSRASGMAVRDLSRQENNVDIKYAYNRGLKKLRSKRPGKRKIRLNPQL